MRRKALEGEKTRTEKPLVLLCAGLVLRIEQAMQVDDKVAHMGVVHGAMGGFLPRVIGLRVVGVDADDIEHLEVAELGSVERFEFAAEYKVQQLQAAFLGILCGHAAASPCLLKFSEI